MAPKIARIVPDSTGFRMSTFPFHFGATTSSQSFGASAALTARVLYAITSGVMYVPNQRPRGSFAAGGTCPAHVGVYGSSSSSSAARAKISDGAPNQRSACGFAFSARRRSSTSCEPMSTHCTSIVGCDASNPCS